MYFCFLRRLHSFSSSASSVIYLNIILSVKEKVPLPSLQVHVFVPVSSFKESFLWALVTLFSKTTWPWMYEFILGFSILPHCLNLFQQLLYYLIQVCIMSQEAGNIQVLCVFLFFKKRFWLFWGSLLFPYEFWDYSIHFRLKWKLRQLLQRQPRGWCS